MKYLHKLYPESIKYYRVACAAVEHEHLDCLKYAYENGCDCGNGNQISLYVATNKKLDCLMFIHKYICNEFSPCGDIFCKHKPWNTFASYHAARNNNIQCLKYLHENGCEWDISVCSGAAEKGALECLKYATENGCDWNIYTCRKAYMYGSIDCLQYLLNTYISEIDMYELESICSDDYKNNKQLKRLYMTFNNVNNYDDTDNLINKYAILS